MRNPFLELEAGDCSSAREFPWLCLLCHKAAQPTRSKDDLIVTYGKAGVALRSNLITGPLRTA